MLLRGDLTVYEHFVIILLIFLNLSSTSLCWTSDDLELFDLVENTNKKFYDVLGVDQKASASDIRKAYRRLSTLYHPDKNKSPDAEETFRKIAAIADVLRNEEKRKKYDLILLNGLPDWRQPIYYYRRVRNMGLLELVVFLFCLLTLGQYLLAWSVYWERKYEIEEVVLSKLRKKAKYQRKGRLLNMDDEFAAKEEICQLPKPRCQDLFPVQLTFFLLYLIKSTPEYIKLWKDSFHFQKKDIIVEDTEEQQEVRSKPRKHVKPLFPDYTFVPQSADSPHEKLVSETELCELKNDNRKKENSVQLSAEAEMKELKRAMKKFPNGTLQRWEKIAEMLNVSVHEVISMTKHMKSLPYTRAIPLSSQGLTGMEKENFDAEPTEEFNEEIETETNKNIQKANIDSFKVNTAVNGTANGLDTSLNCNQDSNDNKIKQSTLEKSWRQDQQRALEMALQKFPKETKARWERIAESVPGKTKEECVSRYKVLAQQIKKKKEKEP